MRYHERKRPHGIVQRVLFAAMVGVHLGAVSVRDALARLRARRAA